MTQALKYYKSRRPHHGNYTGKDCCDEATVSKRTFYRSLEQNMDLNVQQAIFLTFHLLPTILLSPTNHRCNYCWNKAIISRVNTMRQFSFVDERD